VVGNTGPARARLRVYPVDGLTGVTSGAVYSGREDRLRKAGRWLTVSSATMTLAAGGQRRVAFTVRAPASARPGEYLAGIAVEQAHPARTSGGFSITEVVRVVVAVDIRVPGPAAAAARLTSAALKPLPGSNLATVVIGLANRGQLLCRPRLAVALQGAGRARSSSLRLDGVLPGDAIGYPLRWPAGLAPGNYRVFVRATDCGAAVSLDRVVHTQAKLSGPSGRSGAQGPLVVSASPWWLVAVVAGAGLAGRLAVGIGGYARRRRAEDRRPRSPQPTENANASTALIGARHG
jgi:hypothetical protein